MSMPFYVPPEQIMKDRADFARQGIAKGRALIAMQFKEGIVIVAENPSNNLRKVSEIYDRIAFAGVGKYNEFDQLRQGGIRAADLIGYQYSRKDVEARSLANQYAQILGSNFTHEQKPLEVEILIAEVGVTSQEDRLFRISYDGTILDEENFCILGGDAETVGQRLRVLYAPESDLSEAVKAAVFALAGPERTLHSDDLEVATLTRGKDRRCFIRIEHGLLSEILSS